MTVNAVYLQAAFVLRQQKYRETSLILDVFTYDHGRMPLLAKGVRKAKSKTAGLLQPFVALNLSFVGKAGLKTLTGVEIIPSAIKLQGLAVYCGFYLNELLELFLHQHDPHPELFTSYHNCLLQLSDGMALEAVLRRFELELIGQTGYGLQLAYDTQEQPVQAGSRYRYEAGQGLVADQNGLFSGSVLQAIDNKDFSHPQVLSEAKVLMRAVINSHLQGRPLKSRTVINQIIKQL